MKKMFADQLLTESKPLYQDLFHKFAVHARIHARDNEDIAEEVVDLAVSLGYDRDELTHYIDSISLPASIYEADTVKVAEILKQYGGGFMSSLGEALIRADSTNRNLILSTWENDITLMWDHYR